jgi:predicted nucleotidyltransferase
MTYKWETCPPEIKDFVYNLQNEITQILHDEIIGFYIHGSLAMGGFNPKNSDIDVLVVTIKSIKVEIKRKLAQLFLKYSKSPFPIEISFLNKDQLKNWHNPCPFDFHYSEFWRERYENDLLKGTYNFINGKINTDPDLAAHITITRCRGICVKGKPIDEVFPIVPRSDYTSSILGDFQECLENIDVAPIYSTLNLFRVFWYLKESVISSKQEAGEWGLLILPKNMTNTIKKVITCYANEIDAYHFEKEELFLVKDYVFESVQKLLTKEG